MHVTRNTTPVPHGSMRTRPEYAALARLPSASVLPHCGCSPPAETTMMTTARAVQEAAPRRPAAPRTAAPRWVAKVARRDRAAKRKVAQPHKAARPKAEAPRKAAAPWKAARVAKVALPELPA